MFTVKHIFAADEHGPHVENMYEGDTLAFHPAAGNLGALEIRWGENLVAALHGGVAYVMNEAGKTVARYDLPRFDEINQQGGGRRH